MKKISANTKIAKQFLAGLDIKQLHPNSLVVLRFDSKWRLEMVAESIKELRVRLQKIEPAITVVAIANNVDVKNALECVSEEQMNSFGWYRKT